jgi:hypothetical protein
MEVPGDFPLVQYWDAVRRGEEFADTLVSYDDIKSWYKAREDAKASCMKSKGFLYFPNYYWQSDGSESSASADAGYYLSRDYLELPRLPQTRVETQDIGYGIHRPESAVFEDEPDKNQEYIESLSAEAKSAYSIASVGVDRTAPDYDPYNQPDEMGGCSGQAERDFPDPGDAHNDRNVLEQHSDIVADMAERTKHGLIFHEKTVITLNREWRSCMAGKGFELNDWGQEGNRFDGPFQAFLRAMATDPSGKVGQATDASPTLPDEQSRLVGSQVEREIALLDFDCRAETDYLNRFMDAQRKWEQDFVDANRKALDSMKAFVDGFS